MKGSGHRTLHQDVPAPLPCHSRPRELLNRKLLQTSVPPPRRRSCARGPSVMVAPSPLSAVCSALLCSVVFSLRSNVPVAPWGAGPACGVQRAPAWDARRTSCPLGSPHAQLSATTFRLSSQKSQTAACLWACRGPRVGKGAGIGSLPPLRLGNGFAAVSQGGWSSGAACKGW